MIPQYSISQCPLCQTGLCGIRLCGIHTDTPHGLVVCDECEAIWQQPDTTGEHIYPDSENARCPTCQVPLWGQESRWATADDCRFLGWEQAIAPELNADPP